jgi:hypothetical protein
MDVGGNSLLAVFSVPPRSCDKKLALYPQDSGARERLQSSRLSRDSVGQMVSDADKNSVPILCPVRTPACPAVD